MLYCVFKKRCECTQAARQEGRTCRTRFMTGWQTKCLRFGQSSRNCARARETPGKLWRSAKSCHCTRWETWPSQSQSRRWHAAMLSSFCAALQFSTHSFSLSLHFFHSFAVFAHESAVRAFESENPKGKNQNANQNSKQNQQPEVGSTPFNLRTSSQPSVTISCSDWGPTAAPPPAPATTAAAAAKWEILFLFKLKRRADCQPRRARGTELLLLLLLLPPLGRLELLGCLAAWLLSSQWRFRREEDECCATDNTMTPIVFQHLLFPHCWFSTTLSKKNSEGSVPKHWTCKPSVFERD